MRILFLHQNFPGQFHRIVNWLIQQNEHEIVTIRSAPVPAELSDSIRVLPYPVNRIPTGLGEIIEDIPYIASQVADLCQSLAAEGFVPDVVLGHAFWGEPLHIRNIWPDTRMLTYFESYQLAYGMGQLEESNSSRLEKDTRLRRLHSSFETQMLSECDIGISPTEHQKNTYPLPLQDKVQVVHEGVRTNIVKPNAHAKLELRRREAEEPNAEPLELAHGMEVLTYASRFLEPARGYDKLLRILPEIQRERPHCQIIILGAHGNHYGPGLIMAKNGRPELENQVKEELDLSRVHWLGQVPHDVFCTLLQVSRCHLYWTAPVTLSWSFVEAMALGCRLVSCDYPLVSEVVKHGYSALLGNFDDTEKMKENIIRVLTNPEKYDEMAANARREAVKRFDAHTVTCPRLFKLMTEPTKP